MLSTDYATKHTKSQLIMAVSELTSPSFLLAFFLIFKFQTLESSEFSSAQSDVYWSIKMTSAHQSMFLALMLSSPTKHGRSVSALRTKKK